MRQFTLTRTSSFGGYIASNGRLTVTGKTAEDALQRLCDLAGIGEVEVRSFFEASDLLDELIGKPK